MKVGELISALKNYLDEDPEERYLQRLHTENDCSIDCVYYRCGEVVLQSNETDNGNWSLIIPYVIHCLKFFNYNMDVCVQVSDEDLDYAYYDISGYDIIDSYDDNYNKYCRFVLYTSER